MVTVETLDIAVNVIGSWEQELAELAGTLEAVDDIAERVDPIRIDVEVDEKELAKLAPLTALDGGGVDVGVDRGTGIAASGGSPAMSDGGSGSGFISHRDLRRLSSEFGDAFDLTEAVGRGGDITDVRTVIDGDFESHIDMDQLGDAILDDSDPIDLDVLKGLQGSDVDRTVDSVRLLRRRGMTDLPTGGGGLMNWIQTNQFAEKIRGFNMSDLHTLFARTILLFSNFILALPAVIGGLVALGTAAVGAAGALAAIGGLAALGASMQTEQSFMDDMTDAFEDIRDEFLEAFGPIAEQLAPLFSRALDGLTKFFDDLASHSGVLLNFREEAIAFGGALIDWGVNTLVRLVAFADAASQAMGEFGDVFDRDILGGFASMLARILPHLILLFDSIIDGLPGFMRLSEGFLLVASLMAVFISWIFQAIDALGPLGNMIGWVVGGLLALSAAQLIAISVTNLFSGTVIGKAVVSLAAYLKSLGAMMVGLIQFQATTVGAISVTLAFAAAIGLVLGLLTLGAVGVMALSDKFNILGDDIASATSELERFGRMSGRIDGTSLGGTGRGGYIDASSQQTTINVEAASKEEANDLSKTYQYRAEQRHYRMSGQ